MKPKNQMKIILKKLWIKVETRLKFQLEKNEATYLMSDTLRKFKS